MSDVVLTHKFVTCRKAHKCNWCGEIIDPQGIASYDTGIFDQTFYSVYMHPECDSRFQDEARAEGGWLEYWPGEQERGTIDAAKGET